MTCVLSIIGYFSRSKDRGALVSLTIGLVIVDFPDKNNFLTSEETALIKERVERDRGDAVYDPLTFQKALHYACDLKLWSK